MDVVLLIARIGLAAIFVVAAVAKLADRRGTRVSLVEFGLPARLAVPGAIALPAVELTIAVLLLPTATARWGGLAAGVTLLLFTAAIARSLARHQQPDCNCFGQLHSAPVGRGSLVRNSLLVAVAAAIAAAGPGEPIGNALGGADPFAVAIVVVLVAFGWFGYQLFRQNGRLIERVRALEDAVGARTQRPAHGLPERSPAPHFELLDLDGHRRSLDELLGAGRPVALAFSDPGCGACEGLPARLAQLRAERADELEVALITRGAADEARTRVNGHDFGAVLLQENHEIADAYHAPGVPSAVIVGADGRIASPVAMGDVAIDRLLTDREIA